MIHFHPTTKRRIDQFKRIKRGLWSFWMMVFLVVSSLGLEIFINNKALLVSYQGEFYFPTYSKIYSGQTFGRDYAFETKYRELEKTFEAEGAGNFIIMPLIPFNPYENDFSLNASPPNAPSFKHRHLLGTDNSGRDIFARLFYGFRVAIFFSFALYILTSVAGVLMGGLMGYFGGRFDLLMQRIVEIWTSIPTLYLIIILAALVTPSALMLLGILVFAGWTEMTWLMRAEIYRERNRQYAEAAKAMGASHFRILTKHLLPNSLVPIISRFPFQMVGGIGALTSLDYLGYGLPIPTPSWGELLQQGQETFDYAPWILLSPSVATIVVLLLFTFIGEAVRESFDPKQLIEYE
ncbi:MAG: ABC transporter permease subunit [SAR324 cluster bacterium]|nr:ABC transporter permease subunit [SAR324 cluster bacterium]